MRPRITLVRGDASAAPDEQIGSRLLTALDSFVGAGLMVEPEAPHYARESGYVLADAAINGGPQELVTRVTPALVPSSSCAGNPRGRRSRAVVRPRAVRIAGAGGGEQAGGGSRRAPRHADSGATSMAGAAGPPV